MIQTIKPQQGAAFILNKGQVLTVIDPKGAQVSDLVCFSKDNIAEKISSGKTLDFEATINITKGNFIWSNRSRKMLEIIEDSNGQNDFLLAPCSPETFKILYNHEGHHPSCLMNLYTELSNYGISVDDIPNAFNIFMNVKIDNSGKISVLKPKSKAGDHIKFLALEDVIVGLTACSAEDSNGGSFKPIHYAIDN